MLSKTISVFFYIYPLKKIDDLHFQYLSCIYFYNIHMLQSARFLSTMLPSISVPYKKPPSNPKTIVNKVEKMIQSRIATIDAMNTQNKDGHYIEILHTYPAWYNLKLLHRTTAHNPYGHSCISFYERRDNEIISDFVVNVGTKQQDGTLSRSNFIHFIPSHQYFFNNHDENEHIAGNQQDGMLERSFIGISIPVPSKTWHLLKKFYQSVQYQSITGNAEFSMASHILTNMLNPFICGKERGNCCYWTSKGLAHVQLIDKQTSFPMMLFYKFLIDIMTSKQNQPFSITFYKGLHHDLFPNGSFMYPFYWLNNGYSPIWKKELMANVRLELYPKTQTIYDVNITTNDPSDAMEHVKTITSYVKEKIIR